MNDYPTSAAMFLAGNGCKKKKRLEVVTSMKEILREITPIFLEITEPEIH